MSQCMHCRRETAQEKEMLEVKTLHVRDLSGERRIQGLGGVVRGAVCDDCVEAYMQRVKAPGMPLVLRMIAFLALAVVGGILFFVFDELPLRMPCACAVPLGILGAINTKRNAGIKKRLLESLPEGQAREALRLELLCASLPQKDGESNVTYVEIRPELAEANPSALVESNALLPAIAKQAVEKAKEHFTSLRVPEDGATQ